MKYILKTLSYDSKFLFEHGEFHRHTVSIGDWSGPGAHYTITFQSLHDLRTFVEEHGRVIVSHQLDGYEHSDIDLDEIDGEITLVNGEFRCYPASEETPI